MTRQRTFKRRVRDRMAKTGESYTAARRVLIAQGDRPESVVDVFVPPVAEARVVEATGRGWEAWLRLLDEWGAPTRTHTEIARWLRDEHGVDGWYAQSLTVGYERARGLRAPGEHADGFAVGVTRTVAVPVELLFRSFDEETFRARVLPGAGLRRRTSTAPKSGRYDWEDGSTRVIVGFESLAPSKSRVALSHERLPDADTAEEMKLWWRERLDALKAELEGGEIDA